MIFPYAAGGAVFGVFLIRPFMAGLPEELFEAARIDGAGDWQVFFKIALPLCRPNYGDADDHSAPGAVE